MTLINQKMKDGIQGLSDRLAKTTDPEQGMGKPKAVVKMVGPQTCVATYGAFSVVSDEPESLGGYGAAPPPSGLFIASIGMAENVIFARQAALQGVDFDAFETTVEGRWDMKGMFGLDGRDPYLSQILIESRIRTDASPQKIVELVRLTHARCPMTSTVSKAAKVRRRLFVNEVEVPME